MMNNAIDENFESLDPRYLEIYAYCDPASAKVRSNKARGARQAIVVGVRDWLDRWFFIHTWAGKIETSKFKGKILDVQEQFSPRLFGIEANGMQVLFGDLVREEAKLRFGNVKMIPVYQPTNVDKNYRIRSGLEPVINAGRLFLPQNADDAWVELRGFPTAMTKDIVDAIETCIRIAPKRPINVKNDAEVANYAKYLRSTRLSPAIIERKVEEFKRGRRLKLDKE